MKIRRIKKLSSRIIAFLLALYLCAGQGVTYAEETFGYEPTAFAVVDITDMSIYELQQAVCDGYLTYEQIMMLYLDRIYAYSDMYECIIYISDTALEEARECDRIYEESGRTSDIFGLPAIVKDNIDVCGMPTTNGDMSLADNIADDDAPVIAELKEAGAIVVAKANMDKYAEHSQYSISDFGRVNNAYSLDKSSYGSSGGSAVSCAASLAPICIGTDTNASIRVPSSANGVVGIRPTKGLLSTEGVTTLIADRDTAGPIAKTVTDAAIILSAMTGYETDYTLWLDEDALDGMRIGIIDNLANRATGSVGGLFDEAVETLTECGAEVIHMNIRLASSYNCSVSSYKEVFTAAMDKYGVDVVIYPTIYGNALDHSSALSGSSNSNGWYISPSAGVPAITVPMGTDSDGIPSGIEFVARSYDEADIIAAAYAYEQASGVTVKTELAPSLYTSVDEIEELYELKNEGVFPAYSDDTELSAALYDEVLEKYDEAVSYLEESYYDDSDAALRAEELIDGYELAVAAYNASSWHILGGDGDLITRLVMYDAVRDIIK